MREKDYRKLKGTWKQMFDLTCAKKDNNGDLNEFKLEFNQNLLNATLKDQKQKISRGMSSMSELANEIFIQTERSYYSNNTDEFDFDRVLDCVNQADYIHFNHSKEVGKRNEFFIIIKLICPAIRLSSSEKEFVQVNMNTSIDTEISTMTLSVATLPIIKKVIDHEKLELWTKDVVVSHLIECYKRFNPDYEPEKLDWKSKLERFKRNFYARQLI